VFGIEGRIREIVWSADGTLAALSTGAAIYSLPLGSADAELIYEPPSGDDARDLAWSPDNRYLVYRISRSSNSWLEVLEIPDVGVAEDVIVLTPSAPAGNLASYRRTMSMSPLWTPSNALVYPVFRGATPALELVDISGALGG
jgi:hypothetical protein